jgi:hypothetical protein
MQKSKSKCSLSLYSNFLIANQNRYSGLELSRVASDICHDSVSRWLTKGNFNPIEIWNQVKNLVDIKSGYLVCDDSLLDKRYSRVNELAKKQYSGCYHGLVNGICLVNLLWTNSEDFVPVDYRIYQKEKDDKTKNDHFQDMLKKAYKRGFIPKYVLMDSWYSSIENCKFISKKCNWKWMCNLKSNRQISLAKGSYISVSDLALANKQVRKVWLKEYGYILVCELVNKKGDITYLATNDLDLTNYDDFTGHFQNRWKIEEFHRGIKQTTGIEKCYSIKESSQKNHIFAAFTAFAKLEINRIKEQVSWYEQKAMINRQSTINYLKASA